jgi:uncharacterized membrane protein YeiB
VALPAPPDVAARPRLAGVDAARGVALVGMAAVHIFPSRTDDGAESLVYAVASGRSAALFAVLAGVGIALASRRLRGTARRRFRVALVVRALLIALIGLALPLFDAGVAVILVYYALLFLVAIPLLGLGAWRLALLAVAAAVVAPLVSFVLRDGDSGLAAANPTFGTVAADPAGVLEALVLTGYYPVLGWTAYLCAGLAVGRLWLSSRVVAAGLLGVGVALAALASGASWLLLEAFGGLERIAAAGQLDGDVAAAVERTRFGTVPTTTPWWLATDAPHSTTPFDLLHTTGTALAVIGAALLLVSVFRGLLLPLAAAGSMPLTLYCLHVVVLGTLSRGDPLVFWGVQVVAALVLATLWRRFARRGPLEGLVAAVTSRLRTR